MKQNESANGGWNYPISKKRKIKISQTMTYLVLALGGKVFL